MQAKETSIYSLKLKVIGRIREIERQKEFYSYDKERVNLYGLRLAEWHKFLDMVKEEIRNITNGKDD